MPISDLLAQITGDAQPSSPLPNPVQKRKADGDLQLINGKLAKRDSPVINSSRPIVPIKNLPPIAAKPVSNAATSLPPRASFQKASNGTNMTANSLTEPAKPPKKGSYAEILARAKVAQATHGQIGKIQHKPIERGLSKKERQELKEQESNSNRLSKKMSRPGAKSHVRDGRGIVRNKDEKASKRDAPQPEKKIKKAAIATTGYTGTARPNPMASKSTGKSALASRANGKGQDSSSRRYADASEDDKDEDEEDEEDYESDVSSDMEAAAFEVDEEEERAAIIARKEDEEAAKEETRHQREKEEKRRRLAAMVKARR